MSVETPTFGVPRPYQRPKATPTVRFREGPLRTFLFLDPPTGLVALLDCRLVLMCQDFPRQRPEQHREIQDAVAQRAGGDRQAVQPQPARELIEGPVRVIFLKQQQRPHRDAEGSMGEQPRHGRCCDLRRPIRTIAAGAITRTLDHPDVGLPDLGRSYDVRNRVRQHARSGLRGAGLGNDPV